MTITKSTFKVEESESFHALNMTEEGRRDDAPAYKVRWGWVTCLTDSHEQQLQAISDVFR